MKLTQLLVVFSLTLTSSLFAAGCSYHLGFRSRKLPGGYDHVAVPIFKNKTTEVGIETYFTNEMIHQLARSKVAKVVSKGEASVTLEGRIEDLSIAGIAQATQSGVVHLPVGAVLNTAYRLLVKTKILLRRNSDNKVLWESFVQNERIYFAPQLGSPRLNSANALYNQSARHQNIAKMAEDMMAEAHDRLVENF